MSKLTKDERLLILKSLEEELKTLNEETDTPEGPSPQIEENKEPIQIQKPKRKPTEKQLEAMKKGNSILRQKQAEAKKQKEEQARLDKEILEKKIVEKAIKLKKKQIKQNKILYESESESESETTIQKPIRAKPQLAKIEIQKSRFRFIS